MRNKAPLLLVLITLTSMLALSIPTGYAQYHTGTGKLFAYNDKEMTKEVQENATEDYMAMPNTKYYFNIAGITEFKNGDPIHVWVEYGVNNNHNLVKIADCSVGSSSITFDWTIPNLPLTTPIRFIYGTAADGDANGDGEPINIFDIVAVKHHWGETPSSPHWDPQADVYEDGAINIFDITLIKSNWGKWGLYAKRDVLSGPRLLVVVPEVFMGPIAAIGALFIGLGIKNFSRRKKEPQAPDTR
jgi:hypothetical protein